MSTLSLNMESGNRRSSPENRVFDVFILGNNSPMFFPSEFLCWSRYRMAVETISDPENCFVFRSLKLPCFDCTLLSKSVSFFFYYKTTQMITEQRSKMCDVSSSFYEKYLFSKIYRRERVRFFFFSMQSKSYIVRHKNDYFSQLSGRLLACF